MERWVPPAAMATRAEPLEVRPLSPSQADFQYTFLPNQPTYVDPAHVAGVAASVAALAPGSTMVTAAADQ